MKNLNETFAIIRKNAQQKYIGALIKFHYRRVERNQRNTTKLHGIKQVELRKTNDKKPIQNKAHSTVREPRVNVNNHEERIENIQKRMNELKKGQNKERESYPNVSFMPTDHSKKGRGFKACHSY